MVSVDKFENIRDDRIGRVVWHVVLDDFTLSGHEELGKVPVDIAALERTVLSHEFIGWMAIWSIDFALFEERERDVVLLDKLLDLCRSLWLLLSELVAWNSVDFQALALVLVVDLLQLLVVAISQSSECCNVHEENSLFTTSMLSNSAQVISINIFNFVSKYVLNVGDWLSVVEPDFYGCRESLTIRLEVRVVFQAFCKLVLRISDFLVVDKVCVDATNPEVSNGQIWTDNKLTLGGVRLHDGEEFWQCLIEDLLDLLSFFPLFTGDLRLIDNREQSILTL